MAIGFAYSPKFCFEIEVCCIFIKKFASTVILLVFNIINQLWTSFYKIKPISSN
jgi:hypothetical protein